MKLTVKRLFTGCGLFWVVLACLVLYSCHAVPVHAAQSPQENCVSSKDSFGNNTTQCIDGTVTVTGGNGIVICSKTNSGAMVCQKL